VTLASNGAERAELHRTIWRIANDPRCSVDGWHFKSPRLAVSGQPMRTIQEFLGHAVSKTTQIYAHYAPSAHEVEMVNAAIAEVQPTSREPVVPGSSPDTA